MLMIVDLFGLMYRVWRELGRGFPMGKRRGFLVCIFCIVGTEGCPVLCGVALEAVAVVDAVVQLWCNGWVWRDLLLNSLCGDCLRQCWLSN